MERKGERKKTKKQNVKYIKKSKIKIMYIRIKMTKNVSVGVNVFLCK